MSAHSEIVREYIEIRNLLASHHAQPNFRLKVGFLLEYNTLYVFNKRTGHRLELAKVQPQFNHLYVPHYGYGHEEFSRNLAKYINSKRPRHGDLPSKYSDRILELASAFWGTWGVKAAYKS